MSLRRSHSPSPPSRSTSSNNPRDLERRIFVGNLPTDDMDRKDLKELFSSYGKINGVSMFRGYGFVQFERVEEAEAAKAGHKGRLYKGYKIDVNMAAERRQPKLQPRQSPPRSNSYGSYRESRDSRPRSRSPVHGRDHRDGREPRPREHDDRYRAAESRDKDPRGDPAYREEGYDRYYRGAGEDYYRKKEDPYRDPYSRDPWNGRREPEEARAPLEDRRRNELYRQYYEELQRRYDTDRPVDCSVIVVNKAQNREYAETVGRKVRDLGMVVDLIFLNTEVSLTQALEDVGRARTPFAIIITQQHQVHRSCTVNILYGTPQEHRNMPMQDAMVLVADNYDAYKVEHRDKEREEISRKAAKMADEVLIREPDSESHPVSLLPTITLLAESRFITPEELDSLVSYLRDKRDRMVRGSVDSHTAVLPVASHLEAPPPAAVMPSAGHAPPQSSHMALTSASNPPPNPNHQQELQAKILSLFNSGGGAAASTASPSMAPQSYSMGSQLQHQSSSLPPTSAPPPSQSSQMMAARPPMRPPGAPPAGMAQAYGLPPAGRMLAPPGGQRPPTASSGINFDNPSVQKALDTLIQSGPTFNNIVNPGNSPQAPRPGMGQPPPMSMYPRHY